VLLREHAVRQYAYRDDGATAADAEASEVLADGFSRFMRSKLSESFEVQFERVSALVGG